ncbi:hypothetical protein AB0368_36615 [Actinoplanes sp. NPDC051475]|uniref:hypothetical protein n=1 Tax=Actinoplanes sp. NPDC051475 TaxID=3157225 RepID=UPI00344D4652
MQQLVTVIVVEVKARSLTCSTVSAPVASATTTRSLDLRRSLSWEKLWTAFACPTETGASAASVCPDEAHPANPRRRGGVPPLPRATGMTFNSPLSRADRTAGSVSPTIDSPPRALDGDGLGARA